MYFHKRLRQTPPLQVVYKPCLIKLPVKTTKVISQLQLCRKSKSEVFNCAGTSSFSPSLPPTLLLLLPLPGFFPLQLALHGLSNGQLDNGASKGDSFGSECQHWCFKWSQSPPSLKDCPSMSLVFFVDSIFIRNTHYLYVKLNNDIFVC